ncbi:MAG: YvcK family protein, partial [Elusimicrobia bacterium]|nr:YvcK family protein [Elusimicrobiota bacterium]
RWGLNSELARAAGISLYHLRRFLMEGSGLPTFDLPTLRTLYEAALVIEQVEEVRRWYRTEHQALQRIQRQLEDGVPSPQVALQIQEWIGRLYEGAFKWQQSSRMPPAIVQAVHRFEQTVSALPRQDPQALMNSLARLREAFELLGHALGMQLGVRRTARGAKPSRQPISQDRVRAVLAAAHNPQEAAEQLAITTQMLYRYMERYHLRGSWQRAGPEHLQLAGLTTFGARLAAGRYRRDMTQRQLARRAGVGQDEISDIEQGKVSPHRFTKELLSTALGIPLEELEPLIPDVPPEISHLPVAERVKALMAWKRWSQYDLSHYAKTSRLRIRRVVSRGLEEPQLLKAIAGAFGVAPEVLGVSSASESFEELARRLGPQVRASRLARGLSEAQLAAQADVARKTLHRLEAGQPVDGRLVAKIVHALGMDPDILNPPIAQDERGTDRSISVIGWFMPATLLGTFRVEKVTGGLGSLVDSLLDGLVGPFLAVGVVAAVGMGVFSLAARRRRLPPAPVVVIGGGNGTEGISRAVITFQRVLSGEHVKALVSFADNGGSAGAIQSDMTRFWERSRQTQPFFSRLGGKLVRALYQVTPSWVWYSAIGVVPVGSLPHPADPMKAIMGGISERWMQDVLSFRSAQASTAVELFDHALAVLRQHYLVRPTGDERADAVLLDEETARRRLHDPTAERPRGVIGSEQDLEAFIQRWRFYFEVVDQQYVRTGALRFIPVSGDSESPRPHTVKNLLFLGALEAEGALSPGFLHLRAYHRALAMLQGITGSRVLPLLMSPQSSVECCVAGELAGGSPILQGQEAVTNTETSGPIIRVTLRDPRGRIVSPPADPMALRAIREAQLIVIGPGSLESLLPDLEVSGVIEELIAAKSRGVSILWVWNTTQDRNTRAHTVSSMVRLVEESLHATLQKPYRLEQFVTSVVFNTPETDDAALSAYRDTSHQTNFPTHGFWEQEPLARVVRFFQDRGIGVYTGRMAGFFEAPARQPDTMASERHYRYHPSRLAWLVLLQQLVDRFGRILIVSDMNGVLTQSQRRITDRMLFALLEFFRAGGGFAILSRSGSEAVHEQVLEPLFTRLQGPHGGETYRLNLLTYVSSLADFFTFDELRARSAERSTEVYQLVESRDVFEESAQRLLQQAGAQGMTPERVIAGLGHVLEESFSHLAQPVAEPLRAESQQALQQQGELPQLRAWLLVFLKTQIAELEAWSRTTSSEIIPEPLELHTHWQGPEEVVSYLRVPLRSTDPTELQQDEVPRRRRRRPFVALLNDRMRFTLPGEPSVPLQVPIDWRGSRNSAIGDVEGVDKRVGLEMIARYNGVLPDEAIGIDDAAGPGGPGVPLLAATAAGLVPNPELAELDPRLHGHTIIQTEPGPDGVVEYVEIATRLLTAHNPQMPVFFSHLPDGWDGQMEALAASQILDQLARVEGVFRQIGRVQGQNRLGWAHAVAYALSHQEKLDEIAGTAHRLLDQQITHVVYIGVGGPTMMPLSLAGLRGRRHGSPDIAVLNSTDPAAFDALIAGLTRRTASRWNGEPAVPIVREALQHTLFVVVTKEGRTEETNHLAAAVAGTLQRYGVPSWKEHLWYLTDPGSTAWLHAGGMDYPRRPLQLDETGEISSKHQTAAKTPFLLGAELKGFSARALLEHVHRLTSWRDERAHGFVQLAAFLDLWQHQGRHNLALLLPPELHALGPALQHHVEATLPRQFRVFDDVDPMKVADRPSGDPSLVFLEVRYGEDGPSQASPIAARLSAQGYPIASLHLHHGPLGPVADLAAVVEGIQWTTAIIGALEGE